MANVWPVKESKEKARGLPMKGTRTRAMALRGIASLIVGLAWVAFIALFAVFWAPGFNLFQNIVILIASLVGSFLIVGIMWMAYGIRHGFEA